LNYQTTSGYTYILCIDLQSARHETYCIVVKIHKHT